MLRSTPIRVDTVIDAEPAAVWDAVADIGSHVEWMADAVDIRFTSERQDGVGATFDCDTRVGPFRMTDRMEVTAWEPGRTLGIRHVGIVTGEGAFVLSPAGHGRTRFTWDERLWFPWWMGGPIGGIVGRALLRRIWNGNLRRLTERIES